MDMKFEYFLKRRRRMLHAALVEREKIIKEEEIINIRIKKENFLKTLYFTRQ